MSASPPASELVSTLFEHGGNLAAARAAFPAAPGPWLDLSTGINPFAYPLPDLPPGAWTRLPEPAATAGLERTAAQCYGAPGHAEIVAAPGSQALIQALPLIWPTARIGVLGPTYGEHAMRWAAAGSRVVETHRLDDLAACDSAVVVNPNNPDGRLLPVSDLLDLAATLAARGGRLVVDEAFVDALDPVASCVPRLPPRGLVVLRSFGKVYGLAGLRLGFALASAGDAAALRRGFGPWAVSGPAVAIGARALADAAWLAGLRPRLAREAERLDALLRTAGLEVRGGTPLFRLAASPDAPRHFHRLARHGILVRPLSFDPHLLRIGLLRDRGERDRLAAALADDRGPDRASTPRP